MRPNKSLGASLGRDARARDMSAGRVSGMVLVRVLIRQEQEGQGSCEIGSTGTPGPKYCGWPDPKTG